MAKLQDMCARAERSEGELREKMRGWGVNGNDSNEIIASLRRDRYVDDARFASAYARDKMRFSHWGKRKIAQGLAAKRVARDIVADALSQLDDEEYSQALEHVLEAKLKSMPDALSDYEHRAKLYKFLLSRGFESSLITCSFRHRLGSPDR